MTIPPPGPLAYQGQVVVPFINKTFSPTSADNDFSVPTVWVNTSSKAAYLLTAKPLGVANWVFLGDSSTHEFPITPYVVGPLNQAGYQTIQSALNAANAAGGGAVWVQPGTYTENLTCYDNTQVIGAVGFADTGDVVIIGTHTPPSSGGFVFRNVYLQSSTHIFSSSVAGSAHLIIGDAAIAVTNGYTFNLLNWTGKLECFDVNDRGSTNDGFVNNTGGAEVALFTSAVGAGTVNTMRVSGVTSIFTCAIGCPLNCVTGSNVFLEGNVHTGSITFSNNSTGEIVYSEVDAQITMSSSAAWLISETTINTASNPAIAGSGAGTLTLGGITFVNNASIANTLTLSGATGFLPANLNNHGVVLGKGVAPISTVGPSATTGAAFISGGAAADPGFSTTFSVNDASFFALEQASNAGGLVQISLVNTEGANPSSAARYTVGTGGTSAGDSYVFFNNGSAAKIWEIGAQNSSNNFLITNNIPNAATPNISGTTLVSVGGGSNGDTVFTPAGTGRVKIGTGTSSAAVAPDKILLDMSQSVVGGASFFQLNNTDNTSAASSAVFNMTVGGTSAGDVRQYASVVGGSDWSWGIDNSDSDKWKLARGNTLGTNDTIVAATTGNVDFPTSISLAGGTALSSYVEGTWTPGVSFGGGTTGITYTVQNGYYTKVGNMVSVWGYFTLSSKGASVGSAAITGLPFTVKNQTNYSPAATIFPVTLNLDAGNIYVCSIFQANTTTASLYELTITGAATQISDTQFQNTTQIRISGSYQV